MQPKRASDKGDYLDLNERQAEGKSKEQIVSEHQEVDTSAPRYDVLILTLPQLWLWEFDRMIVSASPSKILHETITRVESRHT